MHLRLNPKSFKRPTSFVFVDDITPKPHLALIHHVLLQLQCKPSTALTLITSKSCKKNRKKQTNSDLEQAAHCQVSSRALKVILKICEIFLPLSQN